MDNLMVLGIPSHLRGFIYIIEIIDYILVNNISKIKFNDGIYRLIANKYNISEDSIERDIRYAIEVGYSRTILNINDDYFKNTISYNKNKPTNKQFIITVLNKVREELN